LQAVAAGISSEKRVKKNAAAKGCDHSRGVAGIIPAGKGDGKRPQPVAGRGRRSPPENSTFLQMQAGWSGESRSLLKVFMFKGCLHAVNFT
jgi:hypothetical protein